MQFFYVTIGIKIPFFAFRLLLSRVAPYCDSFDVTIGIKIPFFRVSVTVEPGCSLLQFVTTNCLIFSFFGHSC